MWDRAAWGADTVYLGWTKVTPCWVGDDYVETCSFVVERSGGRADGNTAHGPIGLARGGPSLLSPFAGDGKCGIPGGAEAWFVQPRLIDARFGHASRRSGSADGLARTERGEEDIVPRSGAGLEKSGALFGNFLERGGLAEGEGADGGFAAGLGHEWNVS
ncbi:hypothetical protein [Sphingobium boeckii]|uniref:Uncharacterized protein n=1 Tax=Sphingobium boeckii TaxID=1082345 RepID=A0A7W9AKL0_9SPHN|nr:hypothetical protein [Sphingobium boeckii]MBB5687268.1 hypothetical protein [Sphingobium boeckii]